MTMISTGVASVAIVAIVAMLCVHSFSNKRQQQPRQQPETPSLDWRTVIPNNVWVNDPVTSDLGPTSTCGEEERSPL